LLLQYSANLVAVETRHHHVEQDEIGRFLVAGNRERRLAVGRDADSKIVAEPVDQQLQV
jgi:hypothetical protein